MEKIILTWDMGETRVYASAMLKKYLRPQEAADRISLSKRQVLRLCAQGRIPHVVIGGRVCIPEDRLAVLMERWERETRKSRGGGPDA